MSPLYCLLFLGFLCCLLQTISADPVLLDENESLNDLEQTTSPDDEAEEAEEEDYGPLLIAASPLDVLPEELEDVNPKSTEILAALNATTPAILDLINQKYPDNYGDVRPPFAAQVQRVPHGLLYRINFQVVEIRVTKDYIEDPNFTAFIDEFNEVPEGGEKYRLNDVVQNPSLPLFFNERSDV